MRLLSTILVSIPLLWITRAYSIEISLGSTPLSPCTTAEWSSQNTYGFSAPRRSQHVQTAKIKLIIEGEDLERPDIYAQVESCAQRTAQQIDIRFLAAQPSNSNALFKKVFYACLDPSQLQKKIYYFALKIENHCNKDE